MFAPSQRSPVWVQVIAPHLALPAYPGLERREVACVDRVEDVSNDESGSDSGKRELKKIRYDDDSSDSSLLSESEESEGELLPQSFCQGQHNTHIANPQFTDESSPEPSKRKKKKKKKSKKSSKSRESSMSRKSKKDDDSVDFSIDVSKMSISSPSTKSTKTAETSRSELRR
jgi:hypothetical protein